MLLGTRTVLLEKLIQIHERFLAPLGAVCRKGCAACCTDKVVVTTLEGLAIFNFLEKQGPAGWATRLEQAAGQDLYRPQTTLNAWAGQCLKEDAADEAAEPEPPTGTCLFLTAQACPLYSVRPLACRAMLSRTTCAPGGAADMPEAALTLNIVILQYLEAIDRPGLSGNLVDVLRFLADPLLRQAYLTGELADVPDRLLFNQPLPALMVPPEQRERLRPAIEALQAAVRRPGA